MIFESKEAPTVVTSEWQGDKLVISLDFSNSGFSQLSQALQGVPLSSVEITFVNGQYLQVGANATRLEVPNNS